jgi:phosphate transport system ATP-binding protein
MDEPCSSLDPGSTRRIEETILELKQSMSIVIVTHNMQQAQRVADKTAFFLAEEGEPGRVVEFGSTRELFSIPKDLRTNDYVNGHFG